MHLIHSTHVKPTKNTTTRNQDRYHPLGSSPTRSSPARRNRKRRSTQIPEALRLQTTQSRWVNWDTTKRPINPHTGHPASVTNPHTWANLDTARQRDPTHIGYVLGGGIGCIDLDHCIHPDGTLTPGAQAIVDHYPDSWIEVSPSGEGLHIWGTAPELKGLRRTWHGQTIEFYSKSRYITITGHTWQPGTLQPL